VPAAGTFCEKRLFVWHVFVAAHCKTLSAQRAIKAQINNTKAKFASSIMQLEREGAQL
jgi:hypothetical protein